MAHSVNSVLDKTSLALSVVVLYTLMRLGGCEFCDTVYVSGSRTYDVNGQYFSLNHYGWSCSGQFVYQHDDLGRYVFPVAGYWVGYDGFTEELCTDASVPELAYMRVQDSAWNPEDIVNNWEEKDGYGKWKVNDELEVDCPGEPPDAASDDDDLSPGAIAGIVIGTLGFIILTSVGIACCCKSTKGGKTELVVVGGYADRNTTCPQSDIHASAGAPVTGYDNAATSDTAAAIYDPHAVPSVPPPSYDEATSSMGTLRYPTTTSQMLKSSDLGVIPSAPPISETDITL